MSPPVSRRAIVQPVPLMINPGSLTMGFAGADPRQLAPFVGTTQVGITISAVPPSANQDSRTRTRSSPLEEFKFTTSISIAPSRSPSLQSNQVQHPNDHRSIADGKELDDPEDKR